MTKTFFRFMMAALTHFGVQSLAQRGVVGQFHQSSICRVEDRVRLNCSIALQHIHGLIHCSAECLKLGPCNGVSLARNGTCFLHKDCPYNVMECGDSSQESHVYMERHCMHGVWNTSSQLCDCPEGFSGSRCEIHPRFCSLTNKEVEEERIFIDPEQRGEDPIAVTCITANLKPLLFRSKGLVSFNRTWEEYKRGFYVDEFHFWIGFDAWYRLDRAGCKHVRSKLFIYKDTAVIQATARRYNGFSILNVTNNFKFSYSSIYTHKSPDMVDNYQLSNCFKEHKDTPFSTWDRDNDGDSTENCAARAGSGWWYKSGCERKCNFFGVGPLSQDWKNTPQEQRLYLQGADLESMMVEQSYVDFAYKECPN